MRNFQSRLRRIETALSRLGSSSIGVSRESARRKLALLIFAVLGGRTIIEHAADVGGPALAAEAHAAFERLPDAAEGPRTQDEHARVLAMAKGRHPAGMSGAASPAVAKLAASFARLAGSLGDRPPTRKDSIATWQAWALATSPDSAPGGEASGELSDLKFGATTVRGEGLDAS